MTGEMSKSEVTRENFPIHFACAEYDHMEIEYHLTTVCTSIYDKQLKKAIHVWPKKDKMLLGINSSDKTVIAVELDKQGVEMLISALQRESLDEKDKKTRLHNDNLQLKTAINAILKWADGESKDISTFIKLCVRRYLWGIKL